MRDRLFIDGQWQSAAGGGTFAVENPATGEVLHHAPAATAPDIDRAVLAARRAFEGGWGPVSYTHLTLPTSDLV